MCRQSRYMRVFRSVIAVYSRIESMQIDISLRRQKRVNHYGTIAYKVAFVDFQMA